MTSAASSLLGALTRALGALPRNRLLWAYTIMGVDGSPYITRAFSPRVHGWRSILHQIHRPDADRAPHNHPWRRARFVVVSGGYVEERLTDRGPMQRRLSVGDVNVLDADVYHRIIRVLPDTWTAGLVEERSQDWGFWVEGEGFVHHDDYFARTGFRPEGLGL